MPASKHPAKVQTMALRKADALLSSFRPRDEEVYRQRGSCLCTGRGRPRLPSSPSCLLPLGSSSLADMLPSQLRRLSLSLSLFAAPCVLNVFLKDAILIAQAKFIVLSLSLSLALLCIMYYGWLMLVLLLNKAGGCDYYQTRSKKQEVQRLVTVLVFCSATYRTR